MRLPPRDTLVDRDHIFLHAHDEQELHNPRIGDFKRLHYVSRFEVVLKTIERHAPGRVLLDVGCAQGNFSLALAEKNYSVVAMDLRRSFLRYLLMKHEHGHVSCIAASIESFPFGPARFDVVLLGEILEHVAYPERLLAKAAKLLKPGGVLVATTPNGERWHTGMPSLSAIRDREVLEARQFQPDADGHLFLLTTGELRRLTHEAGLSVVEHRLFGTPWVTGRLRFRHLAQFLPVALRKRLDRITLSLPIVRRFVSDGQLVVAMQATRSSNLGGVL